MNECVCLRAYVSAVDMPWICKTTATTKLFQVMSMGCSFMSGHKSFRVLCWLALPFREPHKCDEYEKAL